MSAKSNNYFITGILICLMGAICFSTKAVLIKLAYRDTQVEPVTLLALRMIFSLPFFVGSAFIHSNKASNVKFTSKEWIAVASIGCLGYYVSSMFDFLGLQYISASIERLILFIYPTLVLIMSYFLFRHRITAIQWWAVGITYGGLLLAFVNEADLQSGGNPDFYKGAIFIFGCAITYAGYIIGSGRLIPKVGAAKFNSYAMSFAALAVLTHFFIVSNDSLFDLSNAIYFYSFLMAIIGTVIPSYLVVEGIKRIGSSNAAIVGSIGPVSTILQAYFFLAEPITFIQVVGTFFILAGVLMISLNKDAGLKSLS